MPATQEMLDYLTSMYPWLDQYLVHADGGTVFVDPKHNAEVLRGIAFGVVDGQIQDLPDEVKAAREEAAQRVGRPIRTDAIEEALLTPQMLYHFASVSEDMSMNMRSHGLFGPPGTGKNFLSAIISGVYHMPYADLSYGSQSFIREDIGDTGIRAREIRDDKGELKGAVPETIFEQGDLTTLLQEPSVVAMNEIDEISAQVPLLFDTFGSGITSDNRVVRTNTPLGKEQVKVDEDAVMIATWNEKPETMLNEAFRSRVQMHEFVYEPSQVIGMMLAYSACTALEENEQLASLRSIDPQELSKHMTWIGDVFQQMANVHRTEQFQYPITFTPRTAARMLASVVLAAGKMAENAVEAQRPHSSERPGPIARLFKDDLKRMLEGFDTQKAAKVMEAKLIEDLEPFVVAPPDGSGMGSPTVSSETMNDLAREGALIRQLLADVLPELPDLAKEVAKAHFKWTLAHQGVDVDDKTIDATLDEVARERDTRRARVSRVKDALVEAGQDMGAAAGAPTLSPLDDAGQGPAPGADPAYDVSY